MTERRQCIIGAGYAGNGVAKAFTDAGIPPPARLTPTALPAPPSPPSSSATTERDVRIAA